MSLRRFQNFQLGALNAGRLNEIVDAIQRLEARIGRAEKTLEPVRSSILVRITGQGVKTSEDGCDGAIPAVAYPFTQVMLVVSQSGAVTAATCVSGAAPEDAISSQRGAVLIKFEAEPSLEVGDAVFADLAPYSAGNADDKAMLYVVTGSAAIGGALRICTLTEAIADGMYKGELNGDREAIEIENLYETQNYYGAASVTLECASLVTGQRLPIGSDVWAMKVQGRASEGQRERDWVTMTPVPFGVECTCGDLGQPLTVVTGTADNDAVAAGIISRIMGGSV
jgi:hypothetical protein